MAMAMAAGVATTSTPVALECAFRGFSAKPAEAAATGPASAVTCPLGFVAAVANGWARIYTIRFGVVKMVGYIYRTCPYTYVSMETLIKSE